MMKVVEMAVKTIALWTAASVLLFAAACGDDDGGTDSGDQTPVGSASASATADERTAAPTARPNASTLEELAAKHLGGVDGTKIKYRYVSNFGQHPDGDWTVYHLDGNVRQDWFASPEGVPNTTVTIVTSGQDYVCSVTDFYGSCSEETEANTISLRVIFLAIDEIPKAVVAGLEAEVTELPSEIYVGKTGQCYQIEIPGRVGEGPVGTESVTLCFSDKGELLYEKRIVNFDDASYPTAHLEIEVTEISEAEASDFEPPYPPS